MTWVKIDDHFDEHPKMQQVGPLAWGYWLAGLAYCNRNLTDGFIPWTKAHTLCSFKIVEDDGSLWELSVTSGIAGEEITSEWVVKLLVEVGLWEEVENGSGRVDGYQIHDYPDYQPLKSQIEEEKAKKVAAGQAGGQASAKARGQAKSNPVPVPVPLIKKNSSSSKKPARVQSEIPEDWEPNQQSRDLAVRYGMPESEIGNQVFLMKRNYENRGALTANPASSWATWCSKYTTYNGQTSNGKSAYVPPSQWNTEGTM